VLVDVARTPVYLWQFGGELRALGGLIALCVLGVVAGTFLGERILRRIPADRFSLVVNVAVGALGVWLLIRAA
jgi:uncharacterized membrane protein YfcA